MKVRIARRHAIGGLAAAAATLARPAAVWAQPGGQFPDRSIRLVVPWPPGGSADAQLRSLAEIAGRQLGQTVVVENRSGASGTAAAIPFAQGQVKPDGYGITQMHLSIIRRPYLVRTPPWDANADFTHIIGLCGWLFGIVVNVNSPIRTMKDYWAYAKANPGKLSYTTSGIATTNHITMEDLSRREGVELLHVPYRASNEAALAVANGEVMSTADSSAWAPLVDAGKLRVLCVWAAERSPRFPDAPTLKELGHDMVVTSPYGLSGPKGMDPGVVRVLHDAMKAALFDDANARVRANFDMPLEYYDTAAYQDFVRRRGDYEKKMSEMLNLRID
jgi:tripartite-type tricarboxylate transporter receptor subunit TctC